MRFGPTTLLIRVILICSPGRSKLPEKAKVLIVPGTRPETIPLLAATKLLDARTDRVLMHAGQGHHYASTEAFFEALGLNELGHFLKADTSSSAAALGSIIQRAEMALQSERPSAFLVLDDTDSRTSAVMTKLIKTPMFHIEAGSRSFDENVLCAVRTALDLSASRELPVEHNVGSISARALGAARSVAHGHVQPSGVAK